VSSEQVVPIPRWSIPILDPNESIPAGHPLINARLARSLSVCLSLPLFVVSILGPPTACWPIVEDVVAVGFSGRGEREGQFWVSSEQVVPIPRWSIINARLARSLSVCLSLPLFVVSILGPPTACWPISEREGG
jgi:hypothetical protein